MKATIRKATPAQKKLPERNHTTIAIMADGKKKSRTLAITIIMMRPMIKRINRAITSNSNPKPRGGSSCIESTSSRFLF